MTRSYPTRRSISVSPPKLASLTSTGASTFTYTVTGTPSTPATGTITATGPTVRAFPNQVLTFHVRVRNTANGETSVRTASYLAFYGETVGLTWVFAVAAGAQTFVLQAQATGTGWALGHGVLTALYVPFDGAGNTP